MQITIYDLALYSIITAFICLLFMRWYLRKFGDNQVQDTLDHTMWLELAFVYRDFTKTQFGKAHYLYYLLIFQIFLITSLFLTGSYSYSRTIDFPINIVSFSISIIAVTTLIALFLKTSRKKYVKEPPDQSIKPQR